MTGGEQVEKAMERRQGTVRELRHTTEVEGGQGDSAVRPVHCAIFTLDERHYVLRSSSPIALEAGDEIVIAGREAGARFNAIAYRNVTRNVRGWLGTAEGPAALEIGCLAFAFAVPVLIYAARVMIGERASAGVFFFWLVALLYGARIRSQQLRAAEVREAIALVDA